MTLPPLAPEVTLDEILEEAQCERRVIDARPCYDRTRVELYCGHIRQLACAEEDVPEVMPCEQCQAIEPRAWTLFNEDRRIYVEVEARTCDEALRNAAERDGPIISGRYTARLGRWVHISGMGGDAA